MPKAKKKKEPDPNKPPIGVLKGVITKTVKKFSLNQQGAWPREMAVMKKLYALYPNPEFWTAFKLDIELNSLAWLVNGDGAETLRRSYLQYALILPKKSTVELEEKPLEKPKESVTIPKTLSDFLSQ